MKTQKVTLFLLVALIICTFQCCTQTNNPVDDVYMYIGAINPKTSGTRPVIKVPGGNVSLLPTFTTIPRQPRLTDWYFADKISGFPLGIGNLIANTGNVKVGINENTSRFDHNLETITPYYYQVLLEDPEINTEYTLTNNTIIFRFTFPENETSNLLLSFTTGEAPRGNAAAPPRGNGTVEIKDKSFEGSYSQGQAQGRSGGGGGGPRGDFGGGSSTYFYAELSKPFSSCGTWQNDEISAGSKTVSGPNAGFYISYPSKEVVELRISTSRTSIDDARNNIIDEVGTMTFDQVKDKAKKLWNEELNLIKVKGGTEKQRQLFYSTLHRTRALRMGNVWDTYRCAYPLQCLIKPEETNRTIQNWLTAYDRTGWLQSSGAMIGHHSTPVIVDAYFRGLRDYDVEKAYQAMKKNHVEATMIPWKDQLYITELEQCYFDNGFFPSLPVRKDFDPNARNDRFSRLPYQTRWLLNPHVDEWVTEVDAGWHRRQSVSVTLEHCYDDWCLAQMAKDLGKEDDYRLFMQRAHNYQNLYKPELGLMAPKTADGQWVEPFDPKYSGGFAGEEYFAEGNSWAYSWHVQHDVQGLINLMGGKDQFLDKLNELFVTTYSMDKLQFFAQMPDMTGLIGMYCHGNEPSFNITYLYNYAGQPWMTQNKVRQMLELWYDTTPFGLSGDEDGGAMSSWYVLSAIGIYPQCPGRPIFDLCSPIFDEVIINVGDGKEFVIEAKNTSIQNKYIQSATLNGKPLNQAWINHSDIVAGGKLVFQMGSRPNKNWASSPEVAPPSMSKPI